MTPTEIRTRAENLVAALTVANPASSLMPFGDAPIERSLADALQSELTPELMQAVIDASLRIVLSRAIGLDAQPGDFQLLAGLAFVSRFAGLVLHPSAAESALVVLMDIAEQSDEAKFATADLVRSLARTDSPIEFSLLALKPDRLDDNLLSAFVELAIAQRQEVALGLIDELLGRGGDHSSLLWNLADSDFFIDRLESLPNAMSRSIRNTVEEALIAMDPNGDALLRWQARCCLEHEDDTFSWNHIDYRRVAA